MRNPHDRSILAFAIPALGTLAADPLVSLVDTAFVGRLGTEPLAALGVNAGIFSMAFLVFSFLAYGTTPLVASAVGENRRDRAGRVVLAALALSTGLGLVAMATLWMLAEPIVGLMGARGSLAAVTLTYLEIRLLAAPAVLLVTAGHGAFRGYGDARTPLVVTLILNLVNLILDPILIFGLQMGIAGAAWATVAAQWVGAILFLALLLGSHRAALQIPLERPRWTEIRRLASVGSILSVRTFALVFTLSTTTALATRLGDQVVAAHQVATQLWLLFALLIDAFALTGQTLIAENLGARRPETARAIADRLLQWGLALGALLAAGLWAGGSTWIWVFELSEPVAAELLAVLPIVALMQPLNALVFVWDGIFMGARAFAYLAKTMVLSATLTLLGLAVVWVVDAGLMGIWVCMGLLICLRGITQAARYYGSPRLLTATETP